MAGVPMGVIAAQLGHAVTRRGLSHPFHNPFRYSKGQEWKSIFLLNAVDGCLPSDLGTGTSAEIEEERRPWCFPQSC
jgi:hypothetical protein